MPMHKQSQKSSKVGREYCTTKQITLKAEKPRCLALISLPNFGHLLARYYYRPGIVLCLLTQYTVHNVQFTHYTVPRLSHS